MKKSKIQENTVVIPKWNTYNNSKCIVPSQDIRYYKFPNTCLEPKVNPALVVEIQLLV